jgi:hypothetical protein
VAGERPHFSGNQSGDQGWIWRLIVMVPCLEVTAVIGAAALLAYVVRLGWQELAELEKLRK